MNILTKSFNLKNLLGEKLTNWLNRNKINPIAFIVFILFLTVYGALITDEIVNDLIVKQDFKKGNFSVTYGKIEEYYEVGVGSIVYLTYEYVVGNTKYNRKLNPIVVFPECNENMNQCASKRFLVIYSKEHPIRSMINLHQEYNGTERIINPKSLSGFE